MASNNKLYRNFVILQEDERGYSNSSDKTLSGYSKIEAKGEKGTYKTVYDKLTCLQINGKWYIQTSAIDIFEDELQEE